MEDSVTQAPHGLFKSEAAKYGSVGILIGACVPVLFIVLQLGVFHPDLTIAQYARTILFDSPENLTTHLLLGGIVFVTGAAGALWGKLKENDLRYRSESSSRNQQLFQTKEDLQSKSVMLERTVDALKALVDVDHIILSTPGRDEMLLSVASKIRELVPADIGCVALLDGESGSFEIIGGWGLDTNRANSLLNNGDFFPAIAMERSRLRANLNEENDLSSMCRLLVESGVKSDICVPINRKGDVVGFFFLGSFMKSGFNNDNLKTTETFASRMGIALEHARLIYGLEEMSINIIHALTTAIDAKSPWTKGHSERVANYAVNIALKMGLDEALVERLQLAGLLHDIGKIGTYDMLLDKAVKLTNEERELIKKHSDRGCEILQPIKELGDIIPAVRHHHERWDGKGYPAGLKGDEVPVMAQILCVADSFDTMISDRPYRPSIGLENAVEELKYCSGTQFSPQVVDTFLDMLQEFGPAKISQAAIVQPIQLTHTVPGHS